ncbi:MAG TPA: 23S rRNA (adenine(2030)-N(6))-methyltransferase RlmJ [Pseudomonadales bacterium]|nr:23S rRNA (adenine(2030)-N(6))-methyltransferase RlmJ [Pseudomonadales bacterium]
MLSYRHSFHAGNHADIIKHTTLCLILESFNQKDKPYFYADTHAGAGCYSLASEHAKATGEFQGGIGKLWQLRDIHPLLSRMMTVVKQYNGGGLRFYPGSPLFAKALMRENDKLTLNEIHPSDAPLLQREFKGDSRAHIEARDGYSFCKDRLPPTPRRGLILMDPSYELKDEYQKLFTSLSEGLKRWETGTYALWYPVVERGKIDDLERKIKRHVKRPTLQVELAMHPDTEGYGMTASGMIVVNPPWKLFEQLAELLPWLASQLEADEQAEQRLQWLIESA